MLTVAYLANQFPAAVEPYVGEEIEELRRRGVQVIPCSIRRPAAERIGSAEASGEEEIVCLRPIRLLLILQAVVLVVRRWQRISGLMRRVILQGGESPMRRLKTLVQTFLGAYYAALLQSRGVDHIHVHHGYFASWIAMTAARLLDVTYSLTLHGSDLLLDGAYLDLKLENCRFCITVSEYNRRYALNHLPDVEPEKILACRLGVDTPERAEWLSRSGSGAHHRFTLITVGRLHAVKDHAFLLRACARLRNSGLDFECAIAGEGPERRRLESLIRKTGLQDRVTLLGHVPRWQMDSLYGRADVVVLTSRSEGIPLVLMEAMARGKIVLAPGITGIPELVIPGKTGFLYAPGVPEDFEAKILLVRELMRAGEVARWSQLDWMRHAARVQALHNYNRAENLASFADRFLQRVAPDSFTPQTSTARFSPSQPLPSQSSRTQSSPIEEWRLSA